MNTRTSPPSTLRSATFPAPEPAATRPAADAAEAAPAKPGRATMVVTVLLAAVLGAVAAVAQFEARGGEIALTVE